ncbi:MAG: rod shape-determining protein [Actinomycetales bacterium]
MPASSLRRPAVPTKARSSRNLAIDLGTTHTRLALGASGEVLEEPTLVAVDDAGTVVAAGWEAWHASRAETRQWQLRSPVREGLVVDPVQTVRLLQLILSAHGLQPESVAVAVPACASAYDTSLLTAAVASATGCWATPVAALLAAGIGLGLPVDEPTAGLVCDIGSGVLELGALGDGRLLSSSAQPLSVRDYISSPAPVLAAAARALVEVLDAVPERTAGDLAAGQLHLVGNGALVADLADTLQEVIGMPVLVADSPSTRVVNGLAACLAEVGSVAEASARRHDQGRRERACQ